MLEAAFAVATLGVTVLRMKLPLHAPGPGEPDDGV